MVSSIIAFLCHFLINKRMYDDMKVDPVIPQSIHRYFPFGYACNKILLLVGCVAYVFVFHQAFEVWDVVDDKIGFFIFTSILLSLSSCALCHDLAMIYYYYYIPDRLAELYAGVTPPSHRLEAFFVCWTRWYFPPDPHDSYLPLLPHDVDP